MYVPPLSPAVEPYERGPPQPVLHLPPVAAGGGRASPPGQPWEALPHGGRVLPPARRSERIAGQLPSYFREQFSSETDSASSSRSRDPDWRPPATTSAAGGRTSLSSSSSSAVATRPGQRLAAAASRIRQRVSNAISRRPAGDRTAAGEGGEVPLNDTFLRDLLGAGGQEDVSQPLPQEDVDMPDEREGSGAAEAAAAAAERRREEEAMELDRREGANRARRPSGRARTVDVAARNRSTLAADRARSRDAALEARRGGLEQGEDSGATDEGAGAAGPTGGKQQ